MTFKIIKPKIENAKPSIDIDTARTALINGMKNDTVINLHSAVEVTGAHDGGQIAGLYHELKQELKLLSNIADEQMAYRKTAPEIIAKINESAVNFDANDIKTYKVEVYGSLVNWRDSIEEKQEPQPEPEIPIEELEVSL